MGSALRELHGLNGADIASNYEECLWSEAVFC